MKIIILYYGRSSRISKIKGVRINLDILEKKLERINNREIAIVSDDKKIFIFVKKKFIKKRYN